MKWFSLLVLIIVPIQIYAQLDNDGKSTVSLEKSGSYDVVSHSILLTGSTLAPFGIKYQYCKNFGGYISYKMDADLIQEDYVISVGIAKSISRNSNLYFGGGVDLGITEFYNEDWFYHKDSGIELEAGWVVKKKNAFSFDIGGGIFINPYSAYYDYSYNEEYLEYRAFLVLGVGYNF